MSKRRRDNCLIYKFNYHPPKRSCCNSAFVSSYMSWKKTNWCLYHFICFIYFIHDYLRKNKLPEPIVKKILKLALSKDKWNTYKYHTYDYGRKHADKGQLQIIQVEQIKFKKRKMISFK